MTLFIADDNEKFRQRLASIINELPGIEVVGQASDVQDSIETINRIRPDTIILDIHMPGGSGLDVLQAAKSIDPGLVVMMLTVGPSSEYREKSLAMGATYFFEKSTNMKKMMTILAKLARRKKNGSKRSTKANDRLHFRRCA